MITGRTISPMAPGVCSASHVAPEKESVVTTVEQTQRTAVQVRPVAGYIGADISGIDISQPLTSQEVAEIRDALLRYKVIFFRGQELTHAAQVAFGSNFGELTYAHPHDEAPPENQPEIFTVDPRRYEERYGKEFRKELRRRDYGYFSGWHTDVTAAVNPPAARSSAPRPCPRSAATRNGPTWWPRTRACRRRCGSSSRRCARNIATVAPDAQGGNGSYAQADPGQPAGRQSTRWSGCTRRPASGRCS